MTKSDNNTLFCGGQLAYTPEQAALVTGRSRSRIFKAIKDGELTARKDGKATVLEHSELNRWVRSFPTIGRKSAAA
jgi:excisionase family DNA binding protein